MNIQEQTSTDYQRLRNLVRKQGYQLRRLRTKLAREWNAGYYITDPTTNTLVVGLRSNSDVGMSPAEVEDWCNS